ncbi:tetracycline efflux MFS transporter Tet(V) [Aeromicrobium alkaliterrae]|uniref:Tetracycline efflux MFS transporter Tet(V) n=1 Tax=Aeromicrobium alkaliterrae TaxID=302168 RepID=A0ABP4VHK8_9ACTN
MKPFRHGQYRWLAAATALSLLADGMWMIATVWQVIDLDGGPKQLSFVAVGWSAGVVATTLVGGVLADRIPQRRIIVGVSVVRVLTASVVGIAAVAGLGAIWHLAVAGLVFGMTAGVFFPAYSAILPSIVDADDLLAANGIEGVLRPIMLQAAGPAAASVIVATISPGHAIVAVALAELACLLLLIGLRPVPLRRDLDAAEGHGVGHLLGDLREGFGYVARTPWLLATLLLATVLVMVSMGPIEVLLPFVIKDDLGGDATSHAWVMAAYGIGGAIASLVVSSLPLARRYLSVMVLMWGAGVLPLAFVGIAPDVVTLAALLFVVGGLFNAPNVIWGTLLQRRVPPPMLGRVSSLDFFVSLTFMPVSMAVAGPLGVAVGTDVVFLVAALIPLPLAFVAIAWARMRVDEIAHPLRPSDRPDSRDAHTLG